MLKLHCSKTLQKQKPWSGKHMAVTYLTHFSSHSLLGSPSSEQAIVMIIHAYLKKIQYACNV